MNVNVNKFFAAEQCTGWVEWVSGFLVERKRCRNWTTDASGRCHIHRTA